MTQLEHKLQQLRIEWTKHPERRDVIEMQVKILKMKPHVAEEPFITRVRKALV